MHTLLEALHACEVGSAAQGKRIKILFVVGKLALNGHASNAVAFCILHFAATPHQHNRGARLPYG